MLKVGLVGCGFMGGMHAACYNEVEGAKLVAVADVRYEKAKELAQKSGAEIYKNGVDLISNADIDVVDICLPTYLHAEHSELAMRLGKHVFIEKPVCLTLEEGKKLIELQKETGAKVQVGQVVRFSDEYKWLKDRYDKNEFGKLKSAVFSRLSSRPKWGWEDWLHVPEKSGSVALDLHIHDADFIRYTFGEPDGFTSQVQRNEKGAIEHIVTTYNYGNAFVTAEGCWDYPDDFQFTEEFRVKFEKATVVYKDGEVTVYPVQGGQIKPEIKNSFVGVNDIGGNISDLGSYYSEIKYFIDNLASEKELEIAPLCEGVKSLELVLDEIKSVGGAGI